MQDILNHEECSLDVSKSTSLNWYINIQIYSLLYSVAQNNIHYPHILFTLYTSDNKTIALSLFHMKTVYLVRQLAEIYIIMWNIVPAVKMQIDYTVCVW